MSYILERRGKLRRWYWQIILSSHGMAYGWAWTKRSAKNKLLRAQAWLHS